MDELISIIIPVYNTKEYLKHCLDSVICQTYQNIEVILIDDGSTDGSESLCDEYAKRDSRIRVIHKENEGQGVARNKGLESAKGSVIAFLDSDDWLRTDALEQLYRKMSVKHLDCVVGAYHCVDESGGLLKEEAYEFPVDTLNGLASVKYFLLNDGIEGFVWNKLWRKTVFQRGEIVFPAMTRYEDIIVVYQALCQCETVGFINEKFYYYRQRSTSTVHQYEPYVITDYLRIADEIGRRAGGEMNLQELGEYYSHRRIVNSAFDYYKHQNLYTRENQKIIRTYVKGRVVDIHPIRVLSFTLKSNLIWKEKAVQLIKMVIVKWLIVW